MSNRREKWLVHQRVVRKSCLVEIAPTVRVLPNMSAGSVGPSEVQTYITASRATTCSHEPFSITLSGAYLRLDERLEKTIKKYEEDGDIRACL